MIKKTLLISTLILSSFSAKSQDGHLSLYDAAPLFLNPAMTGVFEGDWRLHAQYRTQWKAVNYKPYQTGLVSFDLPKNKWGFGAQVMNFRAGIGNYNALQASFSVAYTTSLDSKKYHNLSFGIQGGVTQKTLEYKLLTYDNQYTTSNGGTFDQSIDPQEAFPGHRLFVPVTNAGILYFFAKQESRINPFVGVSAFNLISPQETFLDKDNVLPMRYYGHVGTRINVTELLYFIPKALVMVQEKFWEQTYAVDAGYYLKGSDIYLLGGFVYRVNDATIISLGAKMDNFIAKIGYDINLSSLTPVSAGRGGFELSFTYMQRNNKPKIEKICPRL
ncbi:MAG: PorP/SprF family type IX secretion system membrane protein [Crocinitomicaceae bacterium]|nr:PorP/SprF family type IX secretion system membrane protein [Crocinitomicaceae bacterium]